MRPASRPGSSRCCVELFGEIDFALKHLGGSYPEECRGMGATLSLCWLTAEWLHFGHIGDSRIYYLERATGTLRQISHDDTHIGWLRRNGKISEREARHHPRPHGPAKGAWRRLPVCEPPGRLGLPAAGRYVPALLRMA